MAAHSAGKSSGFKRSRGASLNIRWGARWRPPKAPVTAKIRLIPGNYKGLDGNEYSYYQYVEFYSVRANRNFISSAEWKIDEDGKLIKVGGNCLGQDALDAEIAEGTDREHRSISRRLMHVFNGIHLAWYHLVPVERGDGQPAIYENGKHKGEQILQKVPCDGRKCDMCQEKLPKTFGKKIHWSLGFNHLVNLSGFIDEIERDCAECNGKGTIDKVTYDCSGCGTPIVVCADFDLKDERQANEYSRLIGRPFICKCGRNDVPVAQLECSGCRDPKPLDIFGCDIELKRQGEGTASTVQVVRWVPTVLTDELQEMAKPWNFSEIFAPDPLNIQADILKCRNPYATGGAEAGKEHAREYGKADFDK
jgi:hypothetical protein